MKRATPYILALAACADPGPVEVEQHISRACVYPPPAPVAVGALSDIRTGANLEVSMDWAVVCPTGSDPTLARLVWVWADGYSVTPAAYTCSQGIVRATFTLPCTLGRTELAVGLTVPDPWRDRNLRFELGRAVMPSCW
jgi:hypothetical protein